MIEKEGHPVLFTIKYAILLPKSISDFLGGTSYAVYWKVK